MLFFGIISVYEKYFYKYLLLSKDDARDFNRKKIQKQIFVSGYFDVIVKRCEKIMLKISHFKIWPVLMIIYKSIIDIKRVYKENIVKF